MAKLIPTLEYARYLADRFSAWGLTSEQREEIAQYMFEHDTSVLAAQKEVVGIDFTGKRSKNLFAQYWC